MSAADRAERAVPGGPGHEHQFDPVSGWCAWCNLREDGRLVSPAGAVWRPGRGDIPTHLLQQTGQAS